MHKKGFTLIEICILIILILIPSLYLAGRLSLIQVKHYLFWATLLWFLIALWKFWRERRNTQQLTIIEESNQ
jgi:hypothetical protein